MDIEVSRSLYEWMPLLLLISSVGVILCLCGRKRSTSPLLPRYHETSSVPTPKGGVHSYEGSKTHTGTHFTVQHMENCVDIAPSESPLFVAAELPKLSFRHV